MKAGGHMMGAGRMGAQEQQIVLKTDTGTVAVQLAPTALPYGEESGIGKGDAIEVIGSTVTVGES